MRTIRNGWFWVSIPSKRDFYLLHKWSKRVFRTSHKMFQSRPSGIFIYYHPPQLMPALLVI